MKKIITVLIIILFCFITTINAQTLVDTNKVWTVVDCLNFGACETSIYKFQGDTIISGINYKKLYISSDSTMTFWYYKGAFREDSSKKVFMQSNPNDIFYYDFGLNKNDTVIVQTKQMVVDSIDTVTLITGEKRKILFLHDANYFCVDQWTDGIGSFMGLVNVDEGCAIDIWYELNCFTENDTLKYHNSDYPSCYYSTEGINENTLNHVSVYPNPATDNLTIETNINTEERLEIINMVGQTIHTSNIIKKATINTSAFPNGVYILKLYTDKETVVKKFIKE